MFQCINCGRTHNEKAFVSHSRADRLLVQKIKQYLCQANVSPVLYEYEPRGKVASALDILNHVSNSMATIVLLGPEAAKRPWTQTWIGFEIGASMGTHSNASNSYTIPGILLIEDVSQASDIAVPHVDLVLLLDFFDSSSWTAPEVIAKMINPAVKGNSTLYAEMNSLRLMKLIGGPQFQCPYQDCRACYELYVWAGKSKRDKLQLPVSPRRLSVKCSVCRRYANVSLSRGGSPNPWTSRRALKPQVHISRLV